MKTPIGPAANSITPIATRIAAIMTGRLLVMPTAVITESSEKMMSSTPIWSATSATLDDMMDGRSWPSLPSTSEWISWVPFTSRKSPPENRMMSRQETAKPSIEKTG